MNFFARQGAAGMAGVAFSLVGGLALLAAAALACLHWRFDQTAERTHGVVIAVEPSCGNKGCSYHPVAEFLVDGNKYAVSAKVGSSPPSHKAGDVVEILYQPSDPREARLDTWLENWFVIAMVGGFGALFGGIGLPLLVHAWRRERGRSWAEQNGTLVQARLVGVEQVRTVKARGRSPYRVVAQWQNPRDRKTHRFESEYFWADPSAALQGRQYLNVKVDPQDPRRHSMDTGFLLPPSARR